MSFRDTDDVVAGLLRSEMVLQRKSQGELARIWGCSGAAANRRLLGHVPIDVAELVAAAKFLEKPVEHFLPKPETVPA